jgi:tetratricopeptide (TPR) repeat protein
MAPCGQAAEPGRVKWEMSRGGRRMRRGHVLLVLLSALQVGVVRADEEFDKLKAAFDTALRAWSEYMEEQQSAFQAAQSQPSARAPDPIRDFRPQTKMQALFKELVLSQFEQEPKSAVAYYRRPPDPFREFFPQFRAYAEKYAGQPKAVPALTWMIRTARSGSIHPQEELRWCFEQLRNCHAEEPDLKDALDTLADFSVSTFRELLQPFYEQIIHENEDKNLRATALFNLAKIDYSPQSDPQAATPPASGDPKRAHELFEKVVREYPGTDAATRASTYLFELDHLQIGMLAPDIVGTDVAGREIRLSDFRGRVVVLNFWGFW